MSRFPFTAPAIHRVVFGLPFPGYHRASWPQSWRTYHLPPRSRVYFSSRMRRPMTATPDPKRRFGGSPRDTTRRSFAGRYFLGAILLSPGPYDLGWARPVIHAPPALYPLVLSLRVVFWNRITPFHSPVGEPTSGCPKGEIADGVSRRWADHLPEKSTADGEGDCLRADMSSRRVFIMWMKQAH